MELNKAISIKINKICAEKEMSLNKLAGACCLTQSTLQRLATGTSRNPKLLTIVRLCDGLQMPLKEFFMDEVFDEIERED